MCRSWDLNLDSHEHLQHLHLQNIVPQTFSIDGGCRVHATYVARSGTQELDPTEDFVMWAYSELWHVAGKELSSIRVQDRYRSMEPSGIHEVSMCKALL